MRKGSILVVTLVIVIFLSLTVIMMLALYSQLVNNYTMQQKRLLVSNVAKSGAYVLADYYMNNRSALPNTQTRFRALFSDFKGDIEYEITPDGLEHIVRCVAKLDGIQDSYSLRIIAVAGLTFPYGIVSEKTLELGNNVTINGDVLVRDGDLTVGEGTRIKGNVYLMNGSLNMGNGVVIEKDVFAVGDIRTDQKKTATINGISRASGVIEKDEISGSNNEVDGLDPDFVRDQIRQRIDTSRPPLPVPPNGFSLRMLPNDYVVSDAGYTYYNVVENGVPILKISNTTLRLDTRNVTNGILSIAVNTLDLGNSTTIQVLGDGVVMIYVRDGIYANQLSITMNDKARLLIYSDKSVGDFYFKNGLTVSGGGLYIYAPEKYVQIENAPNTTTPNVNGAVVAKNISMKNSLNLAVPTPFPVDLSVSGSDSPYYGVSTQYKGWGS